MDEIRLRRSQRRDLRGLKSHMCSMWTRSRTTMLENFLHLRKSRGQGCEFLGACATRGQQRRDDVPTFFSNNVTVRFGHFCDQAMRPQQSQATSDGRHLFVLLLFVLGRRVEMGTQITITKSVERKLPTVD